MKTQEHKQTAGHTPGPWDDCSRNESGETIRIFSKCHYIGSIGNSDDAPEQTAANARLIAAAPELLAALEECRDILCSLHASPDALPYLLGKDIPSAIGTGYIALQKAGHPNAQEGK